MMRLTAKLSPSSILLTGLTVWMAAHSPSGTAAEARKPNILIILADDLGYADVGFQGCTDIPTPHIDSLAKNGVRCTNGYVSGPYCSPTRAGLLTGRYQQRFGHEFNPGETDNADIGLPLSETTVADRLKAAGYVTGLVGKWHEGIAARFHPSRRGFDEYFGFLAGGHPYFPGQGAPIYRGTKVVKEKEYLTDAFGREAVSFVTRHKDQPFLLYLAFNAVHTPLHATDEGLKKFASISGPKRKIYAAMLTAMDEAVGKVLETIRSAQLEENTLIFFFSDNGGPTMRGTTINGSRNDPLRGSKRTTLEGGIHVPFVVQWKGKLPGGSVYEQPVIQLDILPTALAAAGVAAKPEWKLDGVDLLPYLNGERSTAPHDALFWRMGDQRAIRQGDWKLVRYNPTVDKPGGIPKDEVRDTSAEKPAESSKNKSGDTSKSAGPGVTPDRLYNLAVDLSERHDLAGENPAKAQELRAAWQAWDKQLARPLWGPGSARDAARQEAVK